MKYFVLLLLGKYLSCPSKDERCASCLGTKCHYCYDGYISSNGKCLAPSTKKDNCMTYSDDGVCK